MRVRSVLDGQLKLEFDEYGSGGKDAVLGWFSEEQGVFLEIATKLVGGAVAASAGRIWIDAGCGSGVLSLGLLKGSGLDLEKLKHVVLAVDINRRAIRCAAANAKHNGLDEYYRFAHGPYCRATAQGSSAAVICHNVPYHISPPQFQPFLPTFSRGAGSDGQALLRYFLEASAYHLAENGMLFGIIGCLGDRHPQFFSYVRDYFKRDRVLWYPVRNPCSTYDFLNYITRGTERAWAETVAHSCPKYHAGVYVIVRDEHGGPIVVVNEILRNAAADWECRWDAHRLVHDLAVEERAKCFSDPGLELQRGQGTTFDMWRPFF